MPETDGDDHQFFVTDLDNHSPIAHPIPPVSSEAASQPFAPLARIIEFADRVQVGLDPSQHRFVEPASSLVELW